MSKTETLTEEQLSAEIERLNELVEALIEAGKYAAAEKENKKLEDYKKRLSVLKTAQQKKQQDDKEEELKQAYEKVTQEFNAKWDEEMRSFEIECTAQLDQLRLRHQKEIEALDAQIQAQEKPPFKPSTELSSLRETEKQLAKLKKFQEAIKAQSAADALEEQERARHDREEEGKWKSLKQQLLTQQAAEMNTLKHRLDKDRKNKVIERGNDMARLDQRYRNFLRGQKADSRAEMNRLKRTENIRTSREIARHLTPARPIQKTALEHLTPAPTSATPAYSPGPSATTGSFRRRSPQSPAVTQSARMASPKF